MTVPNPLTAVPMRAARWSATHPWRAILAWLGFVVVAVSLAVAVPTSRPTGGSASASPAAPSSSWRKPAWTPRTPSTCSSPHPRAADRVATEEAARAVSADLARLDGVDAVAEPQWSPGRDRPALRPGQLTSVADTRRGDGTVSDTDHSRQVEWTARAASRDPSPAA